MHQGDRANSANRLADGSDRFGLGEPASLQAQQRRDRLEIVLDPVVDLLQERSKCSCKMNLEE